MMSWGRRGRCGEERSCGAVREGEVKLDERGIERNGGGIIDGVVVAVVVVCLPDCLTD